MRFLKVLVIHFTALCFLVTQTACDQVQQAAPEFLSCANGLMSGDASGVSGCMKEKGIAAGMNRLDDGVDGMFGVAAVEGDRRDFTLTFDEQQNADEAAAIFGHTATMTAPLMYDPGRPREAKQLKAKLESVAKRYKGRKTLTKAEAKEIVEASRPFINYLIAVKQSRPGSIVIPPGERRSITLAAYCMDRNFAAPKAEEKLHLVPLDTLLSGDLKAIQQDLMRYARLHPEVNHTDLQGIVWLLRGVANPANAGRSLQLSDAQRRLLEAASPGSVEKITSYSDRQQGASSLKKQVFDLLGNNKSLQKAHIRLQPINQNTARNTVTQQLRALQGLPADTSSPISRNTEYTRLADGVAARTTAVNGRADKALLEVVNNGTAPYVLDPSAYVAQAGRKAQRLALHPVAQERNGLDASKAHEVNRWVAGLGIAALVVAAFLTEGMVLVALEGAEGAEGGSFLAELLAKLRIAKRAEATAEAVAEEEAPLAGKPSEPVSPNPLTLEEQNFNSLPQDAKDTFEKYEEAGWKGNVSGQSPGTKAGAGWDNETAQLPEFDSQGNPITYQEFDVNNKVAGAGRDAERFVKGSDGSIYHTDNHYGDLPNGKTPFNKIK